MFENIWVRLKKLMLMRGRAKARTFDGFKECRIRLRTRKVRGSSRGRSRMFGAGILVALEGMFDRRSRGFEDRRVRRSRDFEDIREDVRRHSRFEDLRGLYQTSRDD